MANGSLRAVVYAKGIQMGLTPGFQSSKFTQMSKQTRLYRDLLAPLLPGLTATMFVSLFGRCSAFGNGPWGDPLLCSVENMHPLFDGSHTRL